MADDVTISLLQPTSVISGHNLHITSLNTQSIKLEEIFRRLNLDK